MDFIRKYFSIISGLLLAVTFLWIIVTVFVFPTDILGNSRSISAPQKGFTAPDFKLLNEFGEVVSLSSFQGQPVIVNFWASWCLPCRAEMPAIQRVYETYLEDGLVVLGVNAPNDSRKDVLAFITELGLTFLIVYDKDGSASRDYAVNALPTTYFIDRSGVIQDIAIGGPLSEAYLESQVLALFEQEVK